MSTLEEVATYVRSKNAGPFWVTIDIFCGSEQALARIEAAPALANRRLAELYGVSDNEIRRFAIPTLNVLKLSFPRRVVQGGVNDVDSHAGQYFVPLLALPVD